MTIVHVFGCDSTRFVLAISSDFFIYQLQIGVAVQPADKPRRRSPKQSRSSQTVETLFEAAAQILQNDGEAALTTNRVAEKAGFSIGTLYQYFSCKEVLIKAMADRVRQQVLEEMNLQLAQIEQREQEFQFEPYATLVKVMAALVKCLTMDGKNSALVRLFWTHENPDETAQSMMESSFRLAMFFENMHLRLGLRKPSQTEIYVLTRACVGVVRAVCLERSPLLGSQALIHALSKMAWGILQKDASNFNGS